MSVPPTADPGATDVIIVGAGPTGLMAASLLARCGVSVRILDKNPTAAKESRAFGIQPRSMELFAQINLAEHLLERGLMASGTQIYVSGKRAGELDFDDIGRMDTPFQFLLMVPQSEIEAVLVEDLKRLGVSVERGLEVTAFEQTSDEVLVRASPAPPAVPGPPGAAAAGARNGTGSLELRGRYLIGADGAHSFIRKALGLSFEGAAYPNSFLLADCRVDWPLGYDRFTLLVHGRGLGVFLPLKGKSVARIMALEPSLAATDSSIASQGGSPVSLQDVESVFRRATNIDVHLSDAVWTTRYRVHHRGVNRYSKGRAFVAGDAAHIHSPAGGQGMNTGLQDAANLAWKLALVLRGIAPAALLDTYHSERWPIGDKVLKFTDKTFASLTTQSGWATTLRSALLPLFAASVTHVGMVRNRAFHFISQLGIRYHASAIAQDESSGHAHWSFREGLTAGHRAPNAAIGRNRDVFELCAGYGFNLLALSRRPLGADEIDGLARDLEALGQSSPVPLRTHVIAHSLLGRDARIHRAESPAVFEAYCLQGDTAQALYLIRPDGYIGWRTDSLDVDGCRRFLLRTFKA